MEINDAKIPKIKAWFLDNFPVGIGLKQVLVIIESRSDSYHMFSAPAAPAPRATAISDNDASKKFILILIRLVTIRDGAYKLRMPRSDRMSNILNRFELMIYLTFFIVSITCRSKKLKTKT